MVHGRWLSANHHLLLLRHLLLHDHLLLWHVARLLLHLLGSLALQLIVLVHSLLRVGLHGVRILAVSQHQALSRDLSIGAVLHELRLLLSSS